MLVLLGAEASTKAAAREADEAAQAHHDAHDAGSAHYYSGNDKHGSEEHDLSEEVPPHDFGLTLTKREDANRKHHSGQPEHQQQLPESGKQGTSPPGNGQNSAGQLKGDGSSSFQQVQDTSTSLQDVGVQAVYASR